MRRLTQYEYEEKVYSQVQNEYTVVGIYKNTRTKIEMRHNKCRNNYYVRPHDFLRGERCPFCNPNKKKNINIFRKEVKKLVDDEYSVLGEYINNKTGIEMKHNKCGHVYYVRPNSFISGNRCPKCEELRRKQYNTNNKKYEINEIYFSNWSKDMAYIVGLIAADGCMSPDKYRIRINLIDKELLESIAEKLNYTGPIRKTKSKLGEGYELALNNRQIYKDLEHIGITPRKTFTVNIKNIPSEYEYDFFRGYFDGDGCVYKKEFKDCTKPGIAIDIATASKEMKDTLVTIIEHMIKYPCKIPVQQRENGLYIIRTSTKVSKLIYENMYYEDCLHLERKLQKFEKILEERLS